MREYTDVATLLGAAGPSYTMVNEGDLIRTRREGFIYEVAASDAVRPHVTSAAGAKLYCIPTAAGEITVRQVGGVEGSDITTKLQQAVMVATAGDDGDPIAGTVLVDVLEGTLSDSVHLHYGAGLTGGNQFRGIHVRGLGKKYALGTQHQGTRLTLTATDRPAFTVTNGRSTLIEDIAFIGSALDEVSNSGTTDIDPRGWGIRLEDTWDTALTAAGVTPGKRYAPYAAIAIDPFSGPEPGQGEAYPAWTLHPWIGNGPDQYGQSGSSGTHIKRCYFSGFEVAVVQQPGDESANSDFLMIEESDFFDTKFAISTGSSQARNTTVRNCTFNIIWRLLTNMRHGEAIGTVSGTFENCGVAGFVGGLFELNGLAYGGGLKFDTLDAESLHSLGSIDGGASGDKSLIFENCHISFSHDNDDIVPGFVIEGSTAGRIVFNGGALEGFPSVICTSNISHVEWIGTEIFTRSDRTKAYERIAHNATGGGLVPNLVKPVRQQPRFNPYHVVDGKENPAILSTEFSFSGRDYCVPFFAGQVTYEGADLVGFQTDTPRPWKYRTRRVGNQFALTSQVERTVTITFDAAEFASEQSVSEDGYLPGDVVVHEATGTVMFIRSTDDSGTGGDTYSGGTRVVVLEMQNNYRDVDGTRTVIDDSFMDADEKWVFLPSRVYAPEVPVVGDTLAASANISVRGSSIGTGTDYGLAARDALWSERMKLNTYTSSAAVIQSIDDSSGTITMGGSAAQDATQISFDWWLRQPPANEASR